VQAGQLDKFGRPNENTPQTWTKGYKDLSQSTPVSPMKVDEPSSTPSTPAPVKRKAESSESEPEMSSSEAPKSEKKEKRDVGYT
jgi:H/ACA ribonucleoprotein complex subunit 4